MSARTFIPILLAVVMASSCSPLYVPSVRTLNHFSSRGELNGTALADWSGFEGRAAVSVTNHLMIHAGFSKSFYGLLNQRDTTAVGGIQGSYNHRMLEIGTGYYGRAIGRYVEFEAGYGRGKSNTFEDIPYDPDGVPSSFYPSRVIVAAYDRFYLTGGIALHEKKSLRVAFSTRVSLLKFSNVDSQSTQFKLDTRHRFWFVEPAIDIRHRIKGTPLYFLGNVGFCVRADGGPGRGSHTIRNSARPEVWGWSNVIGLGVHIGKSDTE
jgi:hypothetical protein